MPRAADVPAEDSILCERCGYTLDGLPPNSNCPECGKPVIESTTADGRAPADWESAGGRGLVSFLRTTWRVIVSPSRFFRGTTSRGPVEPALAFAAVHWLIASLLFATAGWYHWFGAMRNNSSRPVNFLAWFGMVLMTFVALRLTTSLAASLSAWEGRYRGIRLPRPVVLRALYYHAAHYLPVALLALVTTAGFAILSERRPFSWGIWQTQYLYVLSGEVVVAAVYLFWTYWAAMRNLMYANR